MFRSLRIKNFRSLEDLEVSTLGRLNLIVGKNNSGKSSVLEALQIFAGNANLPLLKRIADEHDEQTNFEPDYYGLNGPFLPFQELFSGRQFPTNEGDAIFIGESDIDPAALRIQHVYYRETQTSSIEASNGSQVTRNVSTLVPKEHLSNSTEDLVEALLIQKFNRSTRINLTHGTGARLTPPLPLIACSTVSARSSDIEEIAEEWDKIVLTEDAEIIRSALRIFSPEILDIAFVKDLGFSKSGKEQRYGKVRLSNSKEPVPLKSMGDGVLRVLQLVLKAFPARGGILLIDEFENGLHYSVQEDIWKILFKIAEDLDIQIFATTHSWDCIQSFCQVALANCNTQGVLFRLGKSIRTTDKGRTITTVFDEKQLETITQAALEVR